MVNRSDAFGRRLALRLRREHYRMNRMERLGGTSAEISHGAVAGHKVDTDRATQGLRDQLARAQAEFDNYRKRLRREQQQTSDFANLELIEQLLPVLDNFDRAIANPGDSVDGLLGGIKMVRHQLIESLSKRGLESIEAHGQPFDPNLHEAVSVENSDSQPDNHVAEVLQDGYRLNGRLVRPAMVKVTRSP